MDFSPSSPPLSLLSADNCHLSKKSEKEKKLFFFFFYMRVVVVFLIALGAVCHCDTRE
jgi:hypothetical protein